VRHLADCKREANVTNDEAKAWLTDLREKHYLPKNRFERECGQALDLALWLLKREHLVRDMADCKLGAQWLGGELEALQAFEREHPRPGSDSRPPMSDDGPGNTL
jgi:hypothetical protein